MKFLVAVVDGRRVLCTTQADAKKLDPQFTPLDIPVHSAGLLDFVQKLFDEIDTRPEPVTPTAPPPPPPPPPSYADRTMRIEEEFAKLSPFHQMELVHVALENWQQKHVEMFKEQKPSWT